MKPASTSILRPFEERLLAELQRLQRHAEQRAADRAAADDLVQETLLRAWRGRASFDPERELWPWLRVVADNAASRRAEVEARQPETDRAIAVELEPDGSEPEREPPFDVRPFLEKLRAEEREVVERFYFGGASIAEIARDRSCAEGTVKSQLSRARMRLAGMLAGLVLGLGALMWWFWPPPPLEPAPARLAYHSLTVEHIEPEPAKLAVRDLSKTTRRGWTVVGAVTAETQDSPPGDQ
ncbi:ECF RNA polymerase sigma factor SigL [Planctomycetes bacterium Poly30]|uniref:RNA polymerase sigma factor n=1 Tax=Saltatorellus ferox TaxID=2528018 RepID=A0A518ENC6_9BACT|nr:ECF RNA polymerase sigma factor SigL [Planctomycetes bacterium Poly30]